MQATTPEPRRPAGRRGGPASGAGAADARRAARRLRARSAAWALLGLLAAPVLLVARRRRGALALRAGPQRRLARTGCAGRSPGSARSSASGGFQTLTLSMCARYLLALAASRALPLRAARRGGRGRAPDPRCSGRR